MNLLSGRPFWPVRDGLPATFPPLLASTECDVAVIGAGVAGAMAAAFLAEAGLDTLVLDRREAAHGSTAGNTGLVLYELDTMLHRLAARLGRECAGRAYRRCRDAVPALAALVRHWDIDCGLARRPSLFVADRAGYRGQPGDFVRVIAVDDVEVVSVGVSIQSANGTVLEQGAARKIHGVWRYTATQAMPVDETMNITATAVDRPGNEASASVAYP